MAVCTSPPFKSSVKQLDCYLTAVILSFSDEAQERKPELEPNSKRLMKVCLPLTDLPNICAIAFRMLHIAVLQERQLMKQSLSLAEWWTAIQ